MGKFDTIFENRSQTPATPKKPLNTGGTFDSIFADRKPVPVAPSPTPQPPTPQPGFLDKVKGFFGLGGGTSTGEPFKPETTIATAQPFAPPKITELGTPEIPTIKAPTPKSPFEQAYDNVRNFILDPTGEKPTREKAKAMNDYLIEKHPELKPQLTTLDKITNQIDEMSFPEKVLSVTVLGSAVAAPVATGIALAEFTTLDTLAKKTASLITNKKVDNFSDVLPGSTPQYAKDLVDVLSFIGEGLAVHGINVKAPQLAETFTKDITTHYNLPKTVTIEAKEAQNIINGLDTFSEKANLLKTLGLDAGGLKNAAKDGIKIDVPIEKIVTITDKPYWAKLKAKIGVTSAPADTRAFPEGQAPKEGVAGLLEAGNGQFTEIFTKRAPEAAPAPETPIAPPKTAQEAADAYKTKVLDAKQPGEPTVIGTDAIRDVFKDYRTGEPHAIYSQAAAELYTKALEENKNPVVKIIAGGTGSGKSDFILPKISQGFDGIVYDSTLLNYEGAKKQIAEAKKAGKKVEIYGVIPDIARARGYTLLREQETGRPVPLSTFANTHAGAIETLIKLVKDGEDVKVIDLRNVTSRDQVPSSYASDPLAALEKARYTKEEIIKKVENVKLQQQPSNEALAGGQGGSIPPPRENGADQGGAANEPGGGNRILQGTSGDNAIGANVEPPKTQKEAVSEVVKESPKTIKEIAEQTKILEPNVRRILGVGAKEGTFQRVNKGVYVLKKDGKQIAYIEAGDAKEVLKRMASEGDKKFDMVFLDPAYFSRALIGGNRGIKAYDFVSPQDFAETMGYVSKLTATANTHVYLMLSGARTAQADMLKYAQAAEKAGLKVVGEGAYTKLFKDGSPVTNVRGLPAAPERLILFTKSGTARVGEIPKELNFRFIRPSIKEGYATEKPKELLEALIKQSTLEGESVLDPYAGSGVTGAEALKAGRKPTLIEKNPNVVENVIKPRLEGEVRKYQTVHQGGEVKMVEGEPVKIIEGVETFLHKGDGGWIVSEASTGRFLAESRTREGAIAKASFNIDEVGTEKFLELLKEKKITTENPAAGAISKPNEGALKAHFKTAKIKADVAARENLAGVGHARGGGGMAFRPKNLDEIGSPKADAEVRNIIKRSEIAKQLSEKLVIPIRRGKFRKPGAAAIYKPDVSVIRYKQGGTPTIFHEVGHFLDDTVPELGELANKYLFRKKASLEEREALLGEYANPPSDAKMRRGEAFAEFIRFYYTEPEKAQRFAPNLLTGFEEAVKEVPEIADVMKIAAEDYKRWLEMPSVAKVASQISFEANETQLSITKRLADTYHELYEHALDDLHPIEEYVKIAKKKIGNISAIEDPYVLARNFRGWVGKATTFLEKGTFERKYWKVEEGKTVPVYKGKSFKDIIEPIDKAGALQDFKVYLVSRRALELAKRGIRTGINARDAQQALNEMEGKWQQFPGTAEALYKYQDDLLHYGQESGLFDQSALESMRELNQSYVPFFRVMEELESKGYMGRGFANVRNQIKKIKGSDRDIIDPLESIVKNTYSIINAAERNNVALAIARLAHSDPELGRLVEHIPTPQTRIKTNLEEVIKNAFGAMGQQLLSDMPVEVAEKIINIYRPSFYTKANELTVLVNGKPKFYEVDKNLFDAIQGLEVEDVGKVIKLLSFPARFLRAGATLSPDFMVRNPARDQWSALIYSKYGFIPGVDLARGMFSLLGKDDAYWLWRMGGGEHSMLVSLDREYLQKNFGEVLNGKGIVSYFKNPLQALQAVSEFGEQGTRLGEMRKGLARGADPVEAAFASREVTLDFARIGAKTRALNTLIAFWNANVQGMDKMIRAFRDNPTRTTTKVMLGITLPSILLYMHNRDDERWKEIPQWQKDLFWIVMTKEHIYRIPKPFELGILFGSVPERVLEYMDNKDPLLFENLRQSIMSGATPGFIPTGILPVIENTANYSFFMDRQIVPESKTDLPAEAQYTQYTSETAKELGKVLQYSPAKIDNLLHGYFAGLGNYAVQALDEVLKGTNITNPAERPQRKLEDLPLIKAFTIREPIGSGSESVSRFYREADAARASLTYYKDLVKNGEKEEAQRYAAEHTDIVLSPYYETIRRQLSAIAKARTQVLDSRTMGAAEKREKVDKIDRLETDLAAKAVEMHFKKQ